jgi:hypothetical protein
MRTITAGQFFIKLANIKFYENLLNRSRVVTCVQTMDGRSGFNSRSAGLRTRIKIQMCQYNDNPSHDDGALETSCRLYQLHF